MGAQSSIIQRKDHIHALTKLGIPVDTVDFPAATICPFCQARALYIYEDIARSDLWLDCTNCPAHGNILTFAADIWKIDLLAAIENFNAVGVNTREASQDNIKGVVRTDRIQRAYGAFWRLAESQVWQHGDDILSLKFKDLGLSNEIPCRGFVGTATAAQVAEFCSEVWCAYPKRMKSRRPFLVLPYYELPRLFSGLLLIQYQDEFDFKRAFICANPNSRLNSEIREAGYFMLRQATLSAHPTVKNMQFAVDDPLWVIKAQTTQLRHGQELLPICASYYGPEAASLGRAMQSVSRAKRFFYSRTITPELITQAANGHGYICPIKSDSLPRPIMPAKTIRILGQLYRSAVTWQKTLTHVFENKNEVALQSFMSRLSIPVERIREFFARTKIVSEDAAAALIAKVNPTYLMSTESTSYTSHILVRDGCWYTSRGLLICNCIPVIEQVVYTENHKYYAGYVKKQDKKIEFVEKSHQIEKLGLLEYAAQLMAAQKELVIFTPTWNRRAHITAMTFHAPEIVHTRVTPGWDENSREFHCTRYAIEQNGEIKAAPYPDIKTDKTFDLPYPYEVAPASIQELLTPSPDNAFVWTVVAAAIANILSPVAGRSLNSFCLPYELFTAARVILQQIGVKHLELRLCHNAIGAAFARRIARTFWPRMFSLPINGDRMLTESIVKYPNRAAILQIAGPTTTIALSYGWQVIIGDIPAYGANYSAIPYVVAGYLQKAIKQRIGFVGPKRHLTAGILADLHKWLAETYGNTFNLACAEKRLLLPGQEHIALMTELNRAINAQELDIIPRPRQKNQPQNYIIRDGDSWWLNRKAIDRYFNSVSGPSPNWNSLADCFARDGVLRSEKMLHYNSWLLIDRNWCDKFWTNYGDVKSQEAG